jgi:hypothetical protein
VDGGAGCGRFGEQGVKVTKLFLELAQLLGVDWGRTIFDGQGELWFFLAELAFDDLAGAGDGVALVIEEGLDVEGGFYVAAAVETLAGAAFVGLELRELAFPEAEDVGWNVAEPGDFSDAEVEFVRDIGPGWRVGSADWLMLRHARSPVRRGAEWPTDLACRQYRTRWAGYYGFFEWNLSVAGGVSSSGE